MRFGFLFGDPGPPALPAFQVRKNLEPQSRLPEYEEIVRFAEAVLHLFEILPHSSCKIGRKFSTVYRNFFMPMRSL